MNQNNLFRKLKRRFYTALTVGTLGLGAVYGCGDKGNGITDPPPQNPQPQNQTPVITLEASPLSGIAPLEVRAQYACTDPDGANDIAQSRLDVGSYTSGTTSLDSTFTFTNTGTYQVKAYCKDKAGEEVSAGPIYIRVLNPSLSQTAGLTNYVDIDYTATFTSQEATRKTLLNNTLLNTDTLTTSPYSETFQGMVKGDYTFVLEVDGANPDTARVNVPDHESEAPDLSGLNLNLNEQDSLVVPLERATDKNPEDNPVRYISVTSLDGKVNPSIGAFPSDTVLKIKAVGTPGSYQVELGREGSLEKITLQGQILDLPDISGQIQNTRTNLGELSTIQVYNLADSTFLKALDTDPQGNFDFRLDTAVSGILLQARIDKAVPVGLIPGYIRTIRLPGRDTTNLLIRAYPYNDVLYNAGVSRLEFLLHLDETNPTFRRSSVDSIEIIDVDPVDGQSFTRNEQDFIERKILDPTDIRLLVEGRPLYVQIDSSATPDSEKHYSIQSCTGVCGSSSGYEIVPDIGWGIVVPRPRNVPSYEKSFGPDGFRVVTTVGDFVVSHEFAHAYVGYNHATILSQPATILSFSNPSGINLTKPGPVDGEAARIFYEETYKPIESPRLEIYFDILGLNFLPRK